MTRTYTVILKERDRELDRRSIAVDDDDAMQDGPASAAEIAREMISDWCFLRGGESILVVES